jgi:hypothetical protein
MPRKGRFISDNSTYQSLRTTTPNNTQTLHNVLCVGLLTAHLIEREYAVYTKINQAQELVVRIYDDEDKYELIIYPYEDAREVIQTACSRLGGKEELTKLLAQVGRLIEALVSSQSGEKQARVPNT